MSRQNADRFQETSPDEEEALVPSSTLVDAAFCIPDHAKGREISRKFVLEWDNSLSGLASRPGQATWRPQDGHYDCFQSKTRYAPGCARSDTRRGNLEQVIMIGMKIKKVDSTFPCQLCLNIHGCKGNYYLSSGEQISYLVSPKEHNFEKDEIVLLTHPYVNSEYLSRWPGMTASALRTEGIMQVPNEDYVFVDKNHPIIEMIADPDNSDTLQVNIDDAVLLDGHWYKIVSSVVDSCITALETELIANLPIFDLTKFSAQISRPYGVDWDNESEVCDNCPAVTTASKNRLMTSRYRCTVILEMVYCFM